VQTSGYDGRPSKTKIPLRRYTLQKTNRVKNYLIIGAASGIGAQLTAQLAAQGHRVFATWHHQAPFEAGPQVSWHPLDVLDEQPDFGFLPDTLHGMAYCPGSISLKPFALSYSAVGTRLSKNVLPHLAARKENAPSVSMRHLPASPTRQLDVTRKPPRPESSRRMNARVAPTSVAVMPAPKSPLPGGPCNNFQIPFGRPVPQRYLCAQFETIVRAMPGIETLQNVPSCPKILPFVPY